MRKLLCIVISMFLLLSLASPYAVHAEENHCQQFNAAINRLRWYTYWNVLEDEFFPVGTVMDYTSARLCVDAYGKGSVSADDYTYFAYYEIPADIFESAAQDFFAKVDIDAMRAYTSFFWDHENDTGIDDFQHYQPDNHTYLFSSYGGIGDPSWYEVLGYTEEDGLYTVYSRFLSLREDVPQGEEGVDYIRIGEEYFAIEHYLRNVVAIVNGRVQFHSWEEIPELPILQDLITPMTVFYEDESIILEAADGAFPEDTEIVVDSEDETVIEAVRQALGLQLADLIVYDITATAQPVGQMRITINIPADFDKTHMALYYISEDGQAQQLEATVQENASTISVYVDQLGIFALVQIADVSLLPGDANGDGNVNARDARLILRYIAGLVSEEELELSAADYNGDGNINARDARAVLRDIAGLD